MPTSKNRITFICDNEVKETLNQWASEEKRSISNLVEVLVIEAIANRKQGEATGSKRKGEKGEWAEHRVSITWGAIAPQPSTQQIAVKLDRLSQQVEQLAARIDQLVSLLENQAGK